MAHGSRRRVLAWLARSAAGVGAAAALSLVSHHSGADNSGGVPPFCPPIQADLPAAPPLASAAEVGGSPGSFAVTPGGQAMYRIPLTVPPGRAGVQPSLSITYASPGGAEGQRALGVGFSLEGVSVIRRCAKNIEIHGVYAAPSLEDSGEPWCLNDTYLVPVGGVQQGGGEERQQFRTVPDSHQKIVGHRPANKQAWAWFEVFQEDGKIAVYGGTADSKVMAGVVNSVPVELWLSEIRDRRDNAIRYGYDNTMAQGESPAHTLEITLARIEYTHHPSAPAERAVEFEYEVGPKQRLYAFGQERWRSKRMKTIRMKGPGNSEVRRYELSYFGNLLSTAAGRNLLHSVRECADQDCKIPTYFGWEGASLGAAGSNAPFGIHERGTGIDLKALRDAHSEGFQWLLADVNGDGLQDIVVSYRKDDVQTIRVALAAWNHGSSPFDALTTWGSVDVKAGEAVLIPVDHNHDGAMDLVVDWTAHHPEKGEEELDVLIADPDSRSFSQQASGITHAYAEPGEHRMMFTDLDGRGAADRLECWTVAGMPYWWASITEDAGPLLPAGIPNGTMEDLPCHGELLSYDNDGDGRTDLVPYRPDVSLNTSAIELQNGAFVAVNQGTYPVNTYVDSFSLVPGQNPGAQWLDLDKGKTGSGTKVTSRPVITDVNGDGRADVVMVDKLKEDWEPSVEPSIVIHYGGGGEARFVVPPASGSFFDGFADFAHAAAIDLNADGRGDIVVPTRGGCTGGAADARCWVAWITNPEGNGFTRVRLEIPVATESGFTYFPLFYWQSSVSVRARPAVADVNGDGRDDFLVEAPSGELMVYQPQNPPDRLVSVSGGLIDVITMPDVTIEYGPLVDDRRLELDLGLASPAGSPDPLTRYVAKNDAGNPCDMRRGCVASTRQVVTGYTLATGAGAARQYAISYRDGRYDRVLRSFLGFGERLLLDRGSDSGTWEIYDNQTTLALGNAYMPNLVTAYPFMGAPRRVRRWFTATPAQPASAQLMLEYSSELTIHHLVGGGRTYFNVPMVRRERVEESDFLPTPGMLGSLLWVVADQEANPSGISLKDAWSTVTSWDDYGNYLHQTSWTAGVDDNRTTTRTFDVDPTSWLIRRETSSTECSAALGLTQCRELTRSHDPSGLVEYAKTGSASDLSTLLETWITRDTFGNPISVLQRDGAGDQRSSCQRYDSEGVFVIATANPEGHTRYYQVHRGLGVPTGERDANGLHRKRQIDRFGREVYLQEADGRWTKTSYERRDVTGGSPATYHTVVTRTANTGASSEVESDRLGRTVARRRKGPAGASCGAWGCASDATIVEETVYDEEGHVAKQSAPYLAQGPASARYYTEIAYDGYGREIRREEPWGEKRLTTYSGLVVTRESTLGTTVYHRDAAGRDESVTDALGNVTATSFGPFGLVWQTKISSADPGDGAPVVTSAIYDAYGRRLHHEDPDRGARDSAYNGYGELMFEGDALGRTFSHVYDKIGRRVSRTDTEPGGAVNVTTWTYDQGAKGIGRLSSAESPTGVSNSYTYDAFGRPSSSTLKINGESFTAEIAYDAAGRAQTITYPADEEGFSFSTTNAFDANGYLVEVLGKLKVLGLGPNPVFHVKSLWKLTAADTAGRVHGERFGNEVETVTTRDPASQVIDQIETTDADGALLQGLRYAYDGALNITARSDDMQPVFPGKPWLGSTTERFSYDALGRLTCALRTFETAAPSPDCDTELKYDGFGNITSKSDVGAYTYWHGDKPHAVRHAGDSGFEYDAVGNQIGRPGVTVHYTPFDLPRQYDLPGQSLITVEYDGHQERVRRRHDDAETITFGNLYEREYRPDTQSYVHRYFAFSPERRIAVIKREAKDSDQPSYLHAEVLGSLDVITNYKGAVESRFSFDAFGLPRNPDWTAGANVTPAEPFGFTGHTHDRELGLVDMKGRIYDPRIARFLSADPLVSNPLSAQSWNRYSYVQNRPTVFVDPSGFQEAPSAPAPTSTPPPAEDPLPELIGEDGKSSRTTDEGPQYTAPCSGECSTPATKSSAPAPYYQTRKTLTPEDKKEIMKSIQSETEWGVNLLWRYRTGDKEPRLVNRIPSIDVGLDANRRIINIGVDPTKAETVARGVPPVPDCADVIVHNTGTTFIDEVHHRNLEPEEVVERAERDDAAQGVNCFRLLSCGAADSMNLSARSFIEMTSKRIVIAPTTSLMFQDNGLPMSSDKWRVRVWLGGSAEDNDKARPEGSWRVFLKDENWKLYYNSPFDGQ